MAGKAENSAKSGRKATAGSFKPGASPNPGGRPKRTQEELDLIAACKEKSPAALAVIESIMMEGQSEKSKLSAAQFIIERAYGKPVQPVDGQLDVSLQISKIERVIIKK